MYFGDANNTSTNLVDTILENASRFDEVDYSDGFYKIPNKQDMYRALKELSATNRPVIDSRQNILAVRAIGSIVRDFEGGA